MSKKFPQFSDEDADKPQASAKPKRPAVPRGRKPGTEKKPKSGETDEAAEKTVNAPVAEAKVMAEEKPVIELETKWEEATPESVGGPSPTGEGGNKRKRRRRKGKGGGGGSSAPAAAEGAEAVVAASPAPIPQVSKARMNPEDLAKAAWKIYLSEVSEEGVALVGDQDARELARRCFRLAEIFLEERGRR